MKRSSFGLRVIGLTFLLGSVASAQDYQSYNYFPTPDVRTEQLFEPVDVSNYGSGPPRPEGWFADYAMTYMSLTAGDATSIGRAGSSLNTSSFDTEFSSGSRLELGWVEEDVGFLFSASYLGASNQTIWGGGGQTLDPQVNVNDPNGPLLIMQGGSYMTFLGIDDTGFTFTLDAVFREMTIQDKTQAYSGELMRTWRLPRRKPAQAWDPTFEFMAGMRYMRVNSNFKAAGIYQGTVVDPDTLELTPVDESVSWYSGVQNHLLLPQIGSRFMVQRGPVEWSVEGRGFMGVNVQSINQQSRMGPLFVAETFNIIQGQYSTNSVGSAWRSCFALGGELRAGGKYYVTRRIAVDTGATLIFLNNSIGRASQATEYTIRQTGAVMNLNKDQMTYQDFLSAGVSLGFTINR